MSFWRRDCDCSKTRESDIYRHRIMTNGVKFRVETKCGGFWFNECGQGYGYASLPEEFETFEAAEKFIKSKYGWSAIILDRPWRPA